MTTWTTRVGRTATPCTDTRPLKSNLNTSNLASLLPMATYYIWHSYWARDYADSLREENPPRSKAKPSSRQLHLLLFDDWFIFGSKTNSVDSISALPSFGRWNWYSVICETPNGSNENSNNCASSEDFKRGVVHSKKSSYTKKKSEKKSEKSEKKSKDFFLKF